MILLWLACHTPAWFEAPDADVDEDGYPASVDCDDYDVRVNPGAREIWYDGIDQDCDGRDDDADGDGFDRAEDCDDFDRNTYPGAPETWYDGIDSDCSGDNDADQDGDGWSVPRDCDDTDPDVFPGAVDDGTDAIDDDCDGRVAADVDQDGWAIPMDCDDTHPGVHPGADEVWYDGVDQDCDGLDDDQDGDGYALADDCDDTDPTARPGGVEVCDGVDNDCDGELDEDLAGPFTFYEDQDLDGYGSSVEVSAETCAPPAAAAYQDGDCDDGDHRISPDAEEICDDDVDDDCDGAAPQCTAWLASRDAVSSAAVDDLAWLDGARVDLVGTQVQTDGSPVARAHVDELVDLGDVDGDGWSDLGLSGAGHVLLGPLGGAPVELLGQGSASVRAAGDIDGDGLNDVLSAGSVYYGPVEGDLISPDISHDGEALLAFDTQGDGVAELLLFEVDSAQVAFIEWGATQVGDGVYQRSGLEPIAAAGDMTGDGYDDLVLTTTGGALLLRSPVTAHSQPIWASQSGIERLATRDFHDDGRLELLATTSSVMQLWRFDEAWESQDATTLVGTGPTTRIHDDAVWILHADGIHTRAVKPGY